jgi:hypothetical protein
MNNIHLGLVLYVSSGYVVVAFKERYLQPAYMTVCGVRLTLGMLINRDTKDYFVRRLALGKEREVPSSVHYYN